MNTPGTGQLFEDPSGDLYLVTDIGLDTDRDTTLVVFAPLKDMSNTMIQTVNTFLNTFDRAQLTQ